MISVDDFYNEVRECDYRGEHYSVRDNGAVMRHSRSDRRVTKYDNLWTFGKANKEGYSCIASIQVHRIVAIAFYGKPPTPKHVVDHIDTNRQNNRPDNLRWVTRLENVLDNSITRAKIDFICGIDAFLKDPSILKGYESLDRNFSWMRAVSPDEAHISRERLAQWAKERPVSNGGLTGEWLFKASKIKRKKSVGVSKRSAINKDMKSVSAVEIIKMSQSVQIPRIEVSNETKSLTPNVIQVNWRTPTEFPVCPQELVENPLIEYQSRLTQGTIFCHNQYQDCLALHSALVDDNTSLYVMCKSSNGSAIKPWSLAKVTFKDGIYYHESIGTFFNEDGAQKKFTIAQGKEWIGGDVFDELM